MPHYKYRCPECGHELEVFHWINHKGDIMCPECKTFWEPHTNKLLLPTQGYKFKSRKGLTHRPAGGSIEKIT